MAKTRSPNYPIVSLGDALEVIRPVFRAENRNKMSRLVLAQHMGYGSLNGRALGKIGAVRAYGLVEGSGDELRITADAISALTAPEDSGQRRAALERCALKPALFSELRTAFPDRHPSVENLRFQLVQRRFTEDAAGKAAANYLETMCLISGNLEVYNPTSPSEFEEKMHPPIISSVASPVAPRPEQHIERAEFPLPEGIVRVEFPNHLSTESYEEIQAWLNLVLRRVKRSVKEPD